MQSYGLLNFGNCTEAIEHAVKKHSTENVSEVVCFLRSYHILSIHVQAMYVCMHACTSNKQFGHALPIAWHTKGTYIIL